MILKKSSLENFFFRVSLYRFEVGRNLLWEAHFCDLGENSVLKGNLNF